MVLVDSSAWIEGFRRKGDVRVKLALEGLLEAYEAQWCSPVRLEILGGARKDERTRLEKHFSVIPYRQCKEEDWDRAVALAWKIRGEGLNAPWLDVLIASIAIHDKIRLYAIDAHFQEISRLNTGLMLYRPGYNGMFSDGEES